MTVIRRVGVNAVLLAGAAYTFLPLTWLLFAATKNQGDLFGTFGYWFGEMHLVDNLKSLFSESGGIYLRWLLNSLLYAGGGAALGALVCAMAGYAFDKFAFRGKEKLYGLVLAGVLVPATALVIPLYLLAAKVGVANTFWSVFVPVLVNPFGVYLSRVFAGASVPDEVVEAARIDGAGEWLTFRRIALPMMTPGVVTVFLFQFVQIWNNFFLPLVMVSDQRLFPVSLGLYTWNSVTYTFPEFYLLVVTGSLVALVPLVAGFLLLQRFWRAGLAAGAVK
jgi:multiple sugar transport system permease protein